MTALARWCFHHRVIVSFSWILALVVATMLGGATGSKFNDGFSLPGTGSTKAMELLTANVPAQAGDVDTIVWRVAGGPAVPERITSMLGQVAHSAHVTGVSPATTATDGRISFARVQFDQAADKVPVADYKAVIKTVQAARTTGLQVEIGGAGIEHAQEPSLSFTVVIGLVAAAIVLFLAFGSLPAMVLPLVTAIAALGTALPMIGVFSHGIDISSTAEPLGTLVGLGVGVDYALFVVSRHRAGLQAGQSPEEAAVNALNTSGRAVLFAGGTVCVSVLGLLVLGMHFLNGMALATAWVVLVSVAASVTLLPALFGLLGMRVLSRRERRNPRAPQASGGGWADWAGLVRRRSVPLGIASTLLILIMAAPFLSLRLGTADAGNDPAGTTTRKAYDLLAAGFGPGFNGPLLLVSDGAMPQGVAAAAKAVPGVVAVNANGPVLTVIPATAPQDRATSDLIKTLRAQLPAHVYVGGVTATNDDFANRLQSKLPLFVGVVILLGSLLLLLAFRSVVIPVTAAVMNLLAAAASFGVLTAVFQWGWGAEQLGAGRAGPVETFLPVFTLAILFGLSMDYEVFLVSRIHEEWVRTRDNTQAITAGQAVSGRVITAAAAIMMCVFAAFALGGQRVMAEFGIGLAAAVALDAFVLRSILLPAVMNLLGNANWWLPDWLDRRLPHLSIEPSDEESAPHPKPVRV